MTGLLDYRVTLDHIGGDRLGFEYITDSRLETVGGDIYRLLFAAPQILNLLESVDVFLENFQQVLSFAPMHTLKRTILDLR